MTYTKQVPFRPEPTNLRNFINGQILPILRQLVPSHVRLGIQCPREIRLLVDRQMLQQSLANLVLNAIDAVEGEGEIEIIVFLEPPRESGALPTETEVDDGASMTPKGPLVRIVVRDDGPGIPPTDLDKIFDPFFTTKDHGTGLGLPTVQGIAERHGGNIDITTGPEGTSFVLTLPALFGPRDADVGQTGSLDAPQIRGLLLTEDEDLADELDSLLSEVDFTVRRTLSESPETRAQVMAGRYDVIFEDLDHTSFTSPTQRERVLVPRVLLSSAPIGEAWLRDHRDGLTVGLRKPVDLTHLRSTMSRILSGAP